MLDRKILIRKEGCDGKMQFIKSEFDPEQMLK